MLLENKNAIIFGGGGDIGGAVARAFAREGARVFLAGRTLAKLNTVAKEISAAGGEAVFGIIKQNCGMIYVDSEPGQGTTFKIYLLRHEGEVEQAEVIREVEIPSGRGETLLLVEVWKYMRYPADTEVYGLPNA